MVETKITRRQMLFSSSLALCGGGLAGLLSCTRNNNAAVQSHEAVIKKLPFRIGLNTSTIRGFALPVEEQIDLCADAGFDGIELWVRDVESYLEKRGTLESLANRIKQSGLSLENMIGFSNWITDDVIKREEAIGVMRRDMELAAHIGSKYIAAPVQGIHTIERDKLTEYSNRFLQIIELGEQIGVTPLLELWGAGALNQLSDAVAIAIGTGHPHAKMLLDFYHLYRGANSFESLWQLNGAMFPVFHINDYPAEPIRTELKDSDRVFPGDGICPFKEVLPILYRTGFRGCLSVELFNKRYWESMDVKTILRRSYEKTVEVIKESGIADVE